METDLGEFVQRFAASLQENLAGSIVGTDEGLADGTPANNHLSLTSPGTIEIVSEVGGRQRPGDVNQDGELDLSDGIELLGFLILGEPDRLPCGNGTADEPSNQALLDSNGDDLVDLGDAIHVLGYLFGVCHTEICPTPIGGTECVVIAGRPDICHDGE